MREMIRNLKAERDTLADRVDTLTKAIALLEGAKPARKAAKRTIAAPVAFADHVAEHVRTLRGMDLASGPDTTVRTTRTPGGGFRSEIVPPQDPGVDARILRHLGQAGRQTTTEIVEALDMPRGTVSGAMSVLYRDGKVDRALIANPEGSKKYARPHVYAWTVRA